jgi:hypothetical protein
MRMGEHLTTPLIAVPDPVAIINAGYRWDPPKIGVMLTDGVGEIELASVFDVHGGQSLVGRTLALTDDGGPVRSRHGLTFLPRADPATAASRLDRLLVPGAEAAATRAVAPAPGGPEPAYVHDRPGFAFDVSVSDLARTTDVATARWTAKVLELPTNRLVLEEQAWPWGPTAVPVVLVLLSAAVVAGAARQSGRRRGGRQEPPVVGAKQRLATPAAPDR